MPATVHGAFLCVRRCANLISSHSSSMMGWTTWNCHCCRSKRAEYQRFLFSSTCAMISLSLYLRKVKLKTLAQNHMLGKSQQCSTSSGESTPPPLSSSSPPLSPSSPVSSGGLYRWVDDRMCTLKTLLGYSDSYVGGVCGGTRVDSRKLFRRLLQ